MPEEISADKKFLDLSGEMPLIEETETDEEILLSRDLTSAFVKAIKAFRFYPSDNPTLKGLKDQLLRKFQHFLSKYPSFVIQVGQYDLSYKGKILYENRDVKTSLAFSLYKDGLREIRFLKNLEEWEVQGVIDILTQSEPINPSEGDIITMMWERDFVHIRYLAVDEYLEESTVVVPDTVEQFRKNLVLKSVAHLVEAGPGEQDSEEKAGLNAEELSPLVSNPSAYSLTAQEAERLRRDVETEVELSPASNMVGILFEILLLEKEQEPYQDAFHTLIKLLDDFLTLGRFAQATHLLKRVQLLLKAGDLQGWQTEKVEQVLLEAGDEARVARIERALEREEARLEEINAYLLLLSKNSIRPLVKLLGELKNSKARRVFCDALAEIGKDSIELFTPFMEDRRWFLVRNIVYILGRIGKEESLPYIQRAFNHEENRVRREAIQALGLIGGQKTIGLLVRALTDNDVRIRCMAAINLGKMGKKAGLIPLVEIVQSKDFSKREPVEIKAFFNGIGMAGSDEVVSVLQDLLERKSWFGRGRIDETRIGAAQALAMIGTPDAIAVLEEGKNSKDEALREACVRALRSQSP